MIKKWFQRKVRMGLKEALLKMREKKIHKTCLQVYNKTKNSKPDKSERDLFKIL